MGVTSEGNPNSINIQGDVQWPLFSDYLFRVNMSFYRGLGTLYAFAYFLAQSVSYITRTIGVQKRVYFCIFNDF